MAKGTPRDEPIPSVLEFTWGLHQLQTAASSVVNVLYSTKFIDFQNEGTFRVRARQNDRITEIQSRFLIGADGVFSRVRNQLYPSSERKTMMIMQECWQAKGKFKQCR